MFTLKVIHILDGSYTLVIRLVCRVHLKSLRDER